MAISDVATSQGDSSAVPPMRLQGREEVASPQEIPQGTPRATKTLDQIAEERRRSKRETLVTAATTRPAENSGEPSGEPSGAATAEPTRVFVANISMQGIAFRSRERFVKGSLHYLTLSAGPLKLESLVRVQWCRQRSDGTFDIGSQFMEVPGAPVDPPKRSA